MAEDKHSYGTGFLYAEDLLSGKQFHTVNVEISEVHEPHTMRSADGKMIDKWVVGFKGKEKRLCLCKTNASIIHLVTGEPPGDKWVGRKITLQAREIKAFGRETVAIRVIPPAGTKLRKKLYERMGTEAVYESANQGERNAE